MPDGETQCPEALARLNTRVEGRHAFQHHKYLAARSLRRGSRVAVDVGAHIGLWSYWMAQDFASLEAFEPNPETQACWRENVGFVKGFHRLHPVALGDRAGTIALTVPSGCSGGTHVTPGVDGTIPLRTLDSYRFPIVDLLKIDCEGYEPAIIAGGAETIQRCRPVVVVEQSTCGGQGRYGFSMTAAVDALEAMGAVVKTVLGSDPILVFPT